MSDQTVTPVEPSEPASQLPERNPLPDVADIIFVLIIVLLTNLLPNYVLGDGSTGWHLETGHWILDHRAIPQQDIFSALFAGKPWVPYEWLTDVIGASLERLGGLKLVATATACAIAWLFALVYLECRRGGCNFILAMVLTILAVLTSTIHWLARPHIFTFFGVFLMTRHLEKYRTGQETAKRLLFTVGIMMMLWSNLHPAFLVGFALIGIYLCSEIAQAVLTSSALRAPSIARIKTFFAAGVVAVLATFINPNAARMYGYIFEYLRQREVLANTQEYMPPDLHQLHAICMLLILFMFVIGLAGTRRSPGIAPILTVLAFTYLAFSSMRNEPLFVVAAVPIVGWLFGNWSLRKAIGRPYAPAEWLTKLLAKMRPSLENVDLVERTCTMHLLPIATTLLLVASCFFGGKIGPLELIVSDWDPKTKPTATLKCVADNKLDWRHGLNLDNWGGYIYYKTKNRVFIDDRLDFYGSKFYTEYGRMIGLAPDAKELMDKHQIKWIIFPKKSSLVSWLRTSSEWRVLCEDEGATVLVRR